ncbi:MAG TPA: hypothetical protein VEL07_18065 [Planctomycetota bacterium]|nr:hypothetical protein [Planctomycetota bacterium]
MRHIPIRHLLCAAVLSVAGASERVSVPGPDPEDFGFNRLGDVSDDGRYVVFFSTNDYTPSEPDQGIYIRDRLLGGVHLVQHGAGAGEANGLTNARLSGDGSYVLWVTEFGPNRPETKHLERLAWNALISFPIVIDQIDGRLSDGAPRNPAISDNGRYVAWDAPATNLTGYPGGTTTRGKAFWCDVATNDIRPMSADRDGRVDSGDAEVGGISDNGRVVAFATTSERMTDGGRFRGAYVRDAFTFALTRVDRARSGEPANDAVVGVPRISGNGRFVAFSSAASNLVGGDSNGVVDVFVYDRLVWWRPEVTRISVATSGAQANADCLDCSISDNGRYVAFRSAASTLVGGDSNAEFDLFVHDRLFGVTRRVNRRLGGGEPPGRVLPGIVLSGDGRFAAFDSNANGYSAEPVVLREVFIDRAAPLAIDWGGLLRRIFGEFPSAPG